MRNFTLLSAVIALFSWQASAQITTYPYYEDFEGGAAGWTTATTLWELGTPAGTIINSAAGGVNSWATDLDANYPNGADDMVTSPIFDFTSVTNPFISLAIWWNSENSWDGTVLQSSIDGGVSWQNVGAFGQPNWFTDNTISGNPGGQGEGWTGNGNGSWINTSHDLLGLGGQAAVILRFAFGSDGSVNGYDGFAFDNVNIVDLTCPQPTAIVASYLAPDTLILSWTNGGLETSWNYEYGTTGFASGTGTAGVFDSNPDTIIGVMPNMLYDIYIQADCGVNDSSFWTNLNFVSTFQNDDACNAIMVPVDGSTTTYANFGAGVQVGEPGSGDNTVWFTAIVPASGSLAIGTCGENFDTELNVYGVSDCSDFTTYTDLGYADWNPWGCAGDDPAGIELCGLNVGDTLYFWVNGFAGSEGIFPLSVWDLGIDAGTGSSSDVCVGDSINLWPYVSGQSSNAGVWNYPSNAAGIANDSLFVTANATVGGDLIYYIISNACGSDTSETYINVFASSNAGDDGTLTVCQNQPFDLLSGLNGTVDLGGQWYDPANNATASSVVSGSIPGQFNYDYITSNGVCPNDTSNVIVTVEISCDYLDIQEMVFGDMTMYPNPTNGIVTITNPGSEEVFNYELTDVNGQVIATEIAAIKGAASTDVNLEQLESGLYFIKVYNSNAEKTFRVVKQ